MEDHRTRRIPPNMLRIAREMRRPMSPMEARLWFRLRNRQLGYKFRRQEVIGEFIVDFVCPSVRLIVELDGVLHEISKEKDANRTVRLEMQEYKVIRFTNREVADNVEAVLETIVSECDRRLKQTAADPHP